MPPRGELVNPALEWLAAMDGAEFKRWFRGSPLERTGKKRMLRNVAIAMGNSGDRQFLPQLRAWARERMRCWRKLRRGRRGVERIGLVVEVVRDSADWISLRCSIGDELCSFSVFAICR